MRTVKASEVVKGMRVQFDVDREGVTYTITSSVTGTPFIGSARTDIPLGTGGRVIETLPNDHPVTVLAEPEPWVEGAWYRLQVNGNETIARRVEAGWVRWDGVSYPSWEDIDRSRVVTVLGRVLIVDWPGDDVARELKDWPANNALMTAIDDAAAKVADAIRTQGGVR